MELVKFRNSGGLVSISIGIQGLVTWRYVYAADDFQFKKTSNDSGPFLHALGLPHELHFDFNTWDIQLANLSDENQDYELKITWDQDGVRLHSWERSGTLSTEKPADVVSGRILLTGV